MIRAITTVSYTIGGYCLFARNVCLERNKQLSAQERAAATGDGSSKDSQALNGSFYFYQYWYLTTVPVGPETERQRQRLPSRVRAFHLLPYGIQLLVPYARTRDITTWDTTTLELDLITSFDIHLDLINYLGTRVLWILS